MNEIESALSCPKCGSATVRRSRRANAGEMMRMTIGIYPFRCISCRDRFWANVWLFRSWRWAKCPRCLNLNLTDWPKRHYRTSMWTQIRTTLGGQKHRCARCRYNFISFLSRFPDYQGAAADSEDLDFDDERVVNKFAPHTSEPPDS